PGRKWGVLNLDDDFGARLAVQALDRGVRVLGYGFERALPDALRGRRVLRVVGRELAMSADGLAFDIATPWGEGHIATSLVGRFNAANLLGTLGVLLASDYPLH